MNSIVQIHLVFNDHFEVSTKKDKTSYPKEKRSIKKDKTSYLKEKCCIKKDKTSYLKEKCSIPPRLKTKNLKH
jgi:hypothetical protein